MQDKLKEQCNKLISVDKRKYTLIKNILEYDKCFFEMDINTAYSILRDLQVKEKDIKTVYQALIRIENYDN